MHYSLGALAFLVALSASAQDAAPVSLDFGPPGEQQTAHERAALSHAQASGVLGLRVRYVKVEGRGGSSVTLPLKPGDVLTNENLSAAMTALRDAISRSEKAIGLQSKGEVSVLYIAPKFDTSAQVDANGTAQPNDTVGVIFRPYYIDISLVQVGDNLLPIPRSSFPAFIDQIPKPLLVLNPTIGFSYDRAFGAAISAGVAPTLTDQLQLRAEGTKSLSEPFYRADGGLHYALHRDKDAWLRDVSVTANFDGVDEPLGNLEHRRRSGDAELSGKFKLAPNTLLALDAGYRRSDDELHDSITTTRASTNVQLGRAVLDTILPGASGFVRAAIWEDADSQTGSGGAYQRFVGRVGYEKEIAIAPNQTIGVELLGGGGVAANNTPAFARFYGGNAPGQFLYDTIDAISLTQMPTGPLLRSFGENEARLTSSNRRAGGTSFWHANLNLTFPIRAWSRPLIPNEPVEGLTDANGNPLTLKEILKRQIDVTGPSMLAAVLKNEGLSDAEAQARARQVLAEVSPAAHFIIDDANVIALKPLLMFDAAGLSDDGSNETWLAAGGGLQLTIVLAKFEAGYMRTLSGPNFGHEGNAFVRVVFERIF